MLFFVDESWQNIEGVSVGALGGVGVAARSYNPFCREFFRLKRDVLGATELNHSEIKGHTALAKSAFKHEELHGDSHWLEAIDALFDLLERHRVFSFVIWTTNPAYVSLRSPTTTALSKPYKQLLFDFRACHTRVSRKGDLASINFDQRGVKEDEIAASTVANYMVRTSGGWGQVFVQIPNFTVSSVSPGLQSADVTAHLGAHLAAPDARPELGEYADRMRALQYEFKRSGRRYRSIRQVL